MTREEAIVILNHNVSACLHGTEWGEALEMAIKALEQEPCGDAIDRAEAIKIASGYCHPANVAKELAKMPPVTPQPKTGHWIAIDEEPHEDYECDRCGYIASTWCEYIKPSDEYKYCPNCGARMVEPQESEDEE